jgi:hypothetical protein
MSFVLEQFTSIGSTSSLNKYSSYSRDLRLLRVRAGKAPDIIMNHDTLGVISFLFVVRLAISEEDVNRVQFLVKMHHIF